MTAQKVRKAQPKPLQQAYLILTNQKVAFADRIALVDLFFPATQLRISADTPTAQAYKTKLAQVLWQTLMEEGFRLNLDLEYQYQKQLCCIWCGGVVMTYGESQNFEIKCGDCGYQYGEK